MQINVRRGIRKKTFGKDKNLNEKIRRRKFIKTS